MTAVLDAGVEELVAAGVGRRRACVALGRSAASHYRARRPTLPRPARTPAPVGSGPQPRRGRRLVDALDSERFCDRAPAQVWATLLDEGAHLASASVSTMYRLLRGRAQVRERRGVARHPALVKPELVATGPNQVWSWDITKLAGPHKWTWFHLYVILDVYSRYALGWLVAPRESGRLAEELIADAIYAHGVGPGQLALPADRGTSMTSKTVTQLLADLGVLQSHSRPHQSNDDPFSESNFKTLEVLPHLPPSLRRPGGGPGLRGRFFAHYNHDHRHSGIALHTPADVHFGRAWAVRARRQAVLDAAYTERPARFRRPPSAPRLPEAAWINRPEEAFPTTAAF